MSPQSSAILTASLTLSIQLKHSPKELECIHARLQCGIPKTAGEAGPKPSADDVQETVRCVALWFASDADHPLGIPQVYTQRHLKRFVACCQRHLARTHPALPVLDGIARRSLVLYAHALVCVLVHDADVRRRFHMAQVFDFKELGFREDPAAFLY